MARIEFRANTGRIGTHIGDQTNMFPRDIHTFVQTLGNRLGPGVGEMVFGIGFLLHGRSRKRRFRRDGFRRFRHALDGKHIRNTGTKSIRLFFSMAFEGLAIHFHKAGLVVFSSDAHHHVDRPVFFWVEGINFRLAIHNHGEGRRLNATRRLNANILLEQRGDAETNDAVFHASRLLSANQVDINMRRVFQSR